MAAAIVAQLLRRIRRGARSYADVDHPPGSGAGRLGLDLDLYDWINGGLMVLFFFVVGLEIKRELVEGELRDGAGRPARVLRSVGWSCLPWSISRSTPEAGTEGWGIPMATDIALAVGVLA